MNQFQWRGRQNLAIARSVTTCCLCALADGELVTTPGSILRSMCLPVDVALAALAAGETALVAGSDMAQLRAGLRLVHGGEIVDCEL